MEQNKVQFTKQNRIPVVVVESHQHVLEHYHYLLRKKILCLKTKALFVNEENDKDNNCWSMIHIDSHADLSCPGSQVPALACYKPRQEFYPIINNNARESARKRTTTPTKKISASTTSEAIESISDQEQNDSSNVAKNLYEMLDETTSGIAEWIIPLVLAGNLTIVHWIRPKQQHCYEDILCQMPVGKHNFHVGVFEQQSCQYEDILSKEHKNNNNIESSKAQLDRFDQSENVPSSFLDLTVKAIVKVDYADCKYYEDDDSVVENKMLLLSKEVDLLISEMDHQHNLMNTNIETNFAIHTNNFALDICLDYFYCCNPYLIDFDILHATDYTCTLLDLISHSDVYWNRFYHQQQRLQSSTQQGIENIKREEIFHNNTLLLQKNRIEQFHARLVHFLDCCCVNSNDLDTQIGNVWMNNDSVVHDLSDISNSAILRCYEDLKSSFKSAFIDNLEGGENQVDFDYLVSNVLRALLRHEDMSTRTALVSLTAEALPNIHMPHDNLLFVARNDKNIQNIMDINGHDQRKVIEQRLQTFYSIIETILPPANNPPFLISIARSMNDGFTPSSVVEYIQESVLQHLHVYYYGSSYLNEAGTHTGMDNVTAEISKECLSGTCNGSGKCQFDLIFDYGATEGSSFSQFF